MKRFLTGIACLFTSIAFAAILAGCASPSISEQVQLSRKGMLFADSPALAISPEILSTVEPGTDNRGGASAAGCTACQ